MHLSNLKSNIYQLQVKPQNLKHKQKGSTKNINNIQHSPKLII